MYNPSGTLPLSTFFKQKKVRSSGMSLAHAPAQLKGKKELVMEARPFWILLLNMAVCQNLVPPGEHQNSW